MKNKLKEIIISSKTKEQLESAENLINNANKIGKLNKEEYNELMSLIFNLIKQHDEL